MNSAVKTIEPSGILDGTKAKQFREEIISLVESGAETILVDFRDITFMDSSGLGALVVALKAVRAEGGQLFLCSLNNQVKMLLEITSMNKVFQIFSDRDEFEQAVAADKSN